MKKLKGMKKTFCEQFATDGLHAGLIETQAKSEKIAQWFQEQDWAPGNEGAWERFLFFRCFSNKPANPLLVLQMLPLSGMDPEPIPDQNWPFAIQHSLEIILTAEGSPQPQSYITLYEAMIHLHFVVLASQFYWTMEKHATKSAKKSESEICCAYQAVFKAMTDHGCMGGNVWADRACLITIGSNAFRKYLPFPEMVDILEPEELTYNTNKTAENEKCFVLGKSGRARDLIKFASEIRNKMFHVDQVLPMGMVKYQSGLDLLVDLFGILFRSYHGKSLAVVQEMNDADDQKHYGIFCYWDGLTPILSTNSARRSRQKMLSLWNARPIEHLNIIPAPMPPAAGFTWDDSLLFFDPAAPYKRFVFLMPFGFRYVHRRLRVEENINQHIPGLVDSVRWLQDRVQVIIQRTYVGLGPDIRTLSEEIPDDEGIDSGLHFKSLEQVAATIMNRYGLKIPKTSRTFDSYRYEFDLLHGDEALKMARQSVFREKVLDAVEQALANDPDRRLILIGSSGRGKTHIAAQFYKRHEHQCVYLSFDCNVPTMQETVEDQEKEEVGGSLSASIRMHFLSGLCRALNVAEPPSVILGRAEVIHRINALLKQSDLSGPIYIVIDGLNQCPDPEQAFLALPDPLPPNLFLLVTTQPIETVLKEITHYGRKSWGRIELAPLTEKEAHQMMNFYWNRAKANEWPTLPESIAQKLWATCQGQPIFVMAWTDELKKLYQKDPILFEDRAMNLMRTDKGLGLPDSLRDRFESVLEDFEPRRLGETVCLILSMIQRTLTPDEICNGLRAFQRSSLPDFIRPPLFSPLQVEDFLGRMGGFFYLDDTNAGYRFIHETFSRWYQRSIPAELIPDIRLELAPLGCKQLTSESSQEVIELWLQRVDELDPLYKNLPPTVRVDLLFFLREHFAKSHDRERTYSFLFDLVYTFAVVLGEPTRGFTLQQEAEEGLLLPFSDLTKTYLHMTLGRIHHSRVNYDKALNHYHKAVDLMEALPENRRTKKLLWCLTYIYTRIGEIYTWKQDYDRAAFFHEKCLTTRKSFSSMIPSDQNLLSFSKSYNKIGQVKYYSGDIEKALDYFHKALDIREGVLKENQNQTIMTLLAYSYGDFVGLAYRKMGNVEKGLEFSVKSLEICHRLYDELPTIKHAAMLRAKFSTVSKCLKQMGRLNEALKYRWKSIELGEKIAKEIPTIGNRGALSLYYHYMSAIYKAQGDLEATVEHLTKAVQMRETLVKEAQTSTRKRVLAISYCSLSKAYLAKGGVEEAIVYAHKALEVLEPLVLEARGIMNRYQLAMAYEKLGDALLGKRDMDNALMFQEKAFEIGKALKEESSFLLHQRLHPKIGCKLGRIHHTLGNLEIALSLATEAVRILDMLNEKSPTLETRRLLADALAALATIQKSRGERAEAIGAIRRAATLMEKMTHEAPEVAEYPKLLAEYLEAIAGLEGGAYRI